MASVLQTGEDKSQLNLLTHHQEGGGATNLESFRERTISVRPLDNNKYGRNPHEQRRISGRDQATEEEKGRDDTA